LLLGVPDLELAGILSRDRLIAVVSEYTLHALGPATPDKVHSEAYLLQQIQQWRPVATAATLSGEVRLAVVDGIATMLHLGVLVASSDRTLSRPEKKFLLETVHGLGLAPELTQRLARSIPRKAVADVSGALEQLEPALQRVGADHEAMRACLSFVAAVAVVDEVLRRPEIDLYYAIADRLGEVHKEAAVLLEEVRRGYGDFLQSIDPVAAGALSVPTAAALASAFTNGFAPLLLTHSGLAWIGGELSSSALAPADVHGFHPVTNHWRTWASMIVALGAGVALSSYQGPARLDRILPLLLYRSMAPVPELPAPALPDFTTPPW
jgi:hypothetical protein